MGKGNVPTFSTFPHPLSKVGKHAYGADKDMTDDEFCAVIARMALNPELAPMRTPGARSTRMSRRGDRPHRSTGRLGGLGTPRRSTRLCTLRRSTGPKERSSRRICNSIYRLPRLAPAPARPPASRPRGVDRSPGRRGGSRARGKGPGPAPVAAVRRPIPPAPGRRSRARS